MSKKEKIEYPNFDPYEGETKIVNSEIPDGYGIMISGRRHFDDTNHTDEGKQKYEGVWKDGEMHGNGTLVIKEINEDIGDVQVHISDPFDGKKYVGEFQNGKFNGVGTLSFIRAGFAHGSWWKKLNQGNKFAEEYKFYEGSFKDNVFHGKGTIFYSDDTTNKGEWHEGEFISEKS